MSYLELAKAAGDRLAVELPRSAGPLAPDGWDDARERARLNAAMDQCDECARRAESWADCWDWAKGRPDLATGLDTALDAIDAAHRQKDVAANIEACHRLQRAVQAVADAFRKRAS